MPAPRFSGLAATAAAATRAALGDDARAQHDGPTGPGPDPLRTTTGSVSTGVFGDPALAVASDGDRSDDRLLDLPFVGPWLDRAARGTPARLPSGGDDVVAAGRF